MMMPHYEIYFLTPSTLANVEPHKLPLWLKGIVVGLATAVAVLAVAVG